MAREGQFYLWNYEKTRTGDVTITLPLTGRFQTAVRTTLPCHSTSAGRPTFTEMREFTVHLPVAVARGFSQISCPEALSSQTIDAIARRVMDQMSDRVVREIAWEVVPELSELLIRKKLDEQK